MLNHMPRHSTLVTPDSRWQMSTLSKFVKNVSFTETGARLVAVLFPRNGALSVIA
jgi:hypothetical protein